MLAETLRVLDLTDQAIAYGARLLADLGAEVIRVEQSGAVQPGESDGEAESFLQYVHAGKRRVGLNLQTPQARQVLVRLCGNVDVVLDGIEPIIDDVTASYVDVRQIHPHLTWVAVREFARGHREITAESVEIVRCALTGLLSIVGEPGEAPTVVGGGLSNAVVATYAALAAYLGTRVARLSGQGRLVWVSAYEALVSVMPQGLLEAALSGNVVKRTGSRHAHIAAAGLIPCRDGYVVVSANEPRMWKALVDLVGDPRLRDEKLEHADERMRRQSEVFEVLAQWAQGYGKHELAQAAQARRIPVAPVQSPFDILHDEQLQALGFFAQSDQGEPMAYLRTPWASGKVTAARPGEHTESVMQEAGFTRAEIRALEADGVIFGAVSKV